MKEKLRKLTAVTTTRYLLVGGSSFCIEYAVFALLLYATQQLLVSNTLSFLVGLAYSFWLHKHWSFAGEHKHKTQHQFASYFALAAMNVVLSNVLIYVCVNYVSIPALIAKVVAMALIVIWNYAILSKLIFRKHEIDF